MLAMYLCWMVLNCMSAPRSIFFLRFVGSGISAFSMRILVGFLGAVVIGISRMLRLFSLFFAGLL